MNLIICITGASGITLALRFIDNLPKDIKSYIVFSKSAKLALKLENNIKISTLKSSNKNITIYNNEEIGETIASGSFMIDAMIILPCSVNTLAKCSAGISDTLITRSFSVMLKEKKKIILAPREMPYNPIFLENMYKLSKLGVNIAPPVLGYYSNQKTLKDMEDFLIGKWYDLLGISHNLYKRWNGK